METFIYLSVEHRYMYGWEKVMKLSEKSKISEVFGKTLRTDIDPTALTIAIRLIANAVLDRFYMPRGLRLAMEIEAYNLAQEYLDDTSKEPLIDRICGLISGGMDKKDREKMVLAIVDSAYTKIADAVNKLITEFDISDMIGEEDLMILARDMLLVYYYRVFCMAMAFKVDRDYVLKVHEYIVDKYAESNEIIF